MEHVKKILQNRWVFFLLIAFGLDIRIGMAALGQN
jgi:hypothetical protein